MNKKSIIKVMVSFISIVFGVLLMCLFFITYFFGWFDKEEIRVVVLNDEYQLVYTMVFDSIYYPDILTYDNPAGGGGVQENCNEVYYNDYNIFVYSNCSESYEQFKIDLQSKKIGDYEKVELTKESYEMLTLNCSDCQYISYEQLKENPIGKKLKCEGSDCFLVDP